MIKPGTTPLSWVARGLSGVLVANLLFGCGAAPAAAPAHSSPAQSPGVAPLESPLSADLASRDVGRELLDQYDRGHKGYLSAADAVFFQEPTGKASPEFRQADRNNDGRLNLEELNQYFHTQSQPQTAGAVNSQSFLFWGIGGLLAGTLVGGYLTYVGFKGAKEFMHPTRDTSKTTPQDLGMQAENVSLKTDDGISIKGWFIPAAQATDKTVVLLHGHGDNKSSFLPQLAPWLHGKYNLMAFDFRNSGESGGDYNTLGALEQKDVHAVIDYLKGKGQAHIGALGISMGAATVLEEAAGDPRVEAVVSDCAFDSLYDAIESRVALRHYPLPKQGAWAILKVTEMKSHLKLEEQDPIRKVAQIAPRPILFIHGAVDEKTLPEDSQRLFDAARGPKELWLVPGAGHAQAHKTAPAEYEARVLAFFAKSL